MTKQQSSTKDLQQLQIEISIQNYCLDSSEVEQQAISNLIAVETWETWFQCWLENLQDDLPPALGYELSLRLTSDAEIQVLNAQYRQQDKPTDVLAFAALENNFPLPIELRSHLPLYLGDIVVSVDTAARQAHQQQHTLQIELAWLAVHGLLHLLGWDHPDDDSLNQMLTQQANLLEKVNLAINTQH
ncbi:rRNA maturation RNase YbeY [Gloeocapsopsis dulcis]|uniref:rRNA maturation RNase YbeY n=1 Tax=Gloeocapsopsis dulcis TaxID=2859516 RepID=UPI0018C4F094|nr:rRNA maturation RNase YbeY [Gloeocapsopsis dulcis]WNN87618.1 rRNA maturation RNase YbeY [Gloeocapsopsis dulcis]